MVTIVLNGKTYEVRRQENIREIKAGGQWMSSTDFVNWLIENNKHDELSDLYQIGINKAKGVDDSPYKIAKERHQGRNN